MEKVKLFEFENEQAFEDYLISTQFKGWSLFLQHITMDPHVSVGLMSEESKLVALAEVSINEDNELIIHAIQTHEDEIGHGYGTQLFNLIVKKYPHNGIRLRYLDTALMYWIKQGFHFDENMNYLVR